jgi:hypothetical protein
MMARTASLHLIGFFDQRLHDMLDDAFEDGKVIAETYLGVSFAKMLDPYAPEPVKLDARKGIEQASKRVAASKAKFLRESIEFLPFLTTKKRRGAPPKPSETRELEREEFTAKIEAAYRTLRIATGKKPTKKSIAAQLGIGGVDPRKGTDTRSNAFNNKLKRLGINYDAIAARMEVESTL